VTQNIPQGGGSVAGSLGNVAPVANWPTPQDPMAVARQFIGLDKRLLINHDGEWLLYIKNHWESIPTTRVQAAIWRTMEDKYYLDSNGAVRKWMPNSNKTSEVVQALQVIATPKHILGVNVSDAVNGWFGRPDDVQWLRGEPDQVIPCANGLLRLQDRKLLTYTPLHFNRYVLNCDYKPGATSELWNTYLQSSFDGGTCIVLEEWGGYVVSGRQDLEMYLLIVGATRSGKGTYVKVLKAFLPPSAVTGFSAAQLRDRFGKESLIGKSLIVMSDNRTNLRDKRFVEFILETVGLDDHSIRPAYARPHEVFHGVLPGRIVMLSNDPPLFPDDANAVSARTLSAVTQKSFKGTENSDLKEQLVDPANLSGILNRFLDGLDRLNRRGKFVQPESGQVVLDMLSEMGSEVKQFLDQHCELAPNATAAKADVYGRYQQFCNINNFEVLASNVFSAALFTASEHKVRPSKTSPKDQADRKRKVPMYKGLKLKEMCSVSTKYDEW
jgi:putative DNA primase/helicase